MKIAVLVAGVLILSSSIVWAAEDGMPGMPRIRPTRVYTVPSRDAGEELLEDRGFGDEEPMVRMMNLMMVGGSGYEGMDMSAMGKKESSDAEHDHGADHSHSSQPSQQPNQSHQSHSH